MDIEGNVLLLLCATNRPMFGGRVMVWTGIHHDCLVHVESALLAIRYRDEILQHHIIPHVKNNGGMFQHDKARPFAGFKPNRTSLGQYVHHRNPPHQTLPQCLTVLQHEWQNIPQCVGQHLIASMLCHCQAVRDHGDHN